ncbi:MAG: InlB B-repeat-containing protein, partial [Christensenellales bacterium]
MEHQTEQIKQWKKDYIKRERWRKFRLISMSLCYSFMIICFAGILFCATQQKTASEIVVDYARPTYTVSFDANGGTSASSKQVKLGDNYGTLPTPTRTGYTFNGWNGRNLVNLPDRNITFSNTHYNQIYTPLVLTAGTTYTLSFNYSLNSTTSNSVYPSVGCGPYGSYTRDIRYGENYPNIANGSGRVTLSFTPTAEVLQDRPYLALRLARFDSPQSINVDISNIQVEISKSATPYEPYFVTSTTQNTTVGNHTLTARWTANNYSLTMYDNKNILYGGELTTTQDLTSWNSSSNASIVTEDSMSCAKISGSIGSTKYIYQDILSRIQFSSEYIISLKAKVVNYVAGSTNPFLSIYASGDYNNNGTSTWYSLLGGRGLSEYNGQGWKNIYYHTNSNSSATSSTATRAELCIYARDFTGDVFFRNYSLAL